MLLAAAFPGITSEPTADCVVRSCVTLLVAGHASTVSGAWLSCRGTSVPASLSYQTNPLLTMDRPLCRARQCNTPLRGMLTFREGMVYQSSKIRSPVGPRQATWRCSAHLLHRHSLCCFTAPRHNGLRDCSSEDRDQRLWSHRSPRDPCSMWQGQRASGCHQWCVEVAPHFVRRRATLR